MGSTNLMDTNVFGNLNRVNSGPRMAATLMEMRAAGDKLVVARSAYAEILRTPGDALRNAQLQQIKDFQMEIQPDYTNAGTNAVYQEWNSRGQQQKGVSAQDLDIVADVRGYMEIHPAEDVELFTTERMLGNKLGIEGTYKIKFSPRCRPEVKQGEILPYDPVKLGVKQAEAPAAPDMPPAMPEIPLPVPGPGATETFMSAAKASFKEGIKGLWSADTAVQVVAVVVMTIADRYAMREAIRKLQSKFIKEGFAKGLAAGAMGWQESEVTSNAMNRVTLFRMHGLADPAGYLELSFMFKVAQSLENFAVGYGYWFAYSKPLEWKKDWCARGFALLSKFGYNFGDNPDALFEYDCLQKFAWAMRTASDAIAEPGIHFS